MAASFEVSTQQLSLTFSEPAYNNGLYTDIVVEGASGVQYVGDSELSNSGNTIVTLMSDNGASSGSPRVSFPVGEFNAVDGDVPFPAVTDFPVTLM